MKGASELLKSTFVTGIFSVLVAVITVSIPILYSQISSVDERLSGIQTGAVHCDGVVVSASDEYGPVKTLRVNFERGYKEIPQISIFPTQLELYYKPGQLAYKLDIENASTYGFDIKISLAYVDAFTHCSISWMAVGEVS